MRKTGLLLIALAGLAAAQPPDSQRYERLAALGKLWTFVKYTHPAATAVDWDQALVRAMPKVSAAKTEDEFLDAADAMLGELKDPATFVRPKRQETMPDGSQSGPSSRKTDDSILIVTVGNGPFQTMQAQLMKLVRFDGVKAAVIDLRGSMMARYVFPRAWPVTRPVRGPYRASRRHDGYAPPPERAMGSGGYSSKWDLSATADLQPSASQVPGVFLVNSGSSIPPAAIALQDAGVAAIVSEDPIDDSALGGVTRFPLPGGKFAVVRIEEVLYPDGTTGFAPNRVLGASGEAALNAAVEIARSGKWDPPSRTKRALPPAGYVEKSYADQLYPGVELRLMAGFRVWGVFHYFFPYYHLIGEDWDGVLLDTLPKLEKAASAREYHLAVAAMVARANDSHCFMSSRELTAFYGYMGPAPLQLRWIEDQPVVTRVADAAKQAGVSVGDVVVKIDGQPPSKRMDELRPYIAASTPQSRINRLMSMLLSGDAGSTLTLSLRGASGEVREVKLQRSGEAAAALIKPADPTPFRLINDRIGYVNLTLLEPGQVGEMFEKFRKTAAIIMDMRGYPRGTAWAIAPRLTEQRSPVAAQFRRCVVDPSSGEARDSLRFYFEQRLPPTEEWRYKGKTVMLIDERAISQSEHSGLFYKTANGTVFIGSATAGANGDVTSFWAPGGISINFSGHDVRWAEGRQLQRVGLQPDIEVKPTIAGIRSGRDEVLEKAIEYLSK